MIDLTNYIKLVLSNENIFMDIYCEGIEKEAIELEKLCDLNIKRERLVMAWSTIISCLIEKYYHKAIFTFLTDKTLNFLINNSICLIDLGHLNLSDEWLNKIYNADNRCWEALKTIEKRKNQIKSKSI